MLGFPNAKINIGLYITDRRQDGYHDLETVFYPLTALHDALEITTAKDQATITISGKAVAGNKEDNLVWKAYRLLKDKYPDKVPALDIHLLKAIPMGAGLGGGSADGAVMLQLVNSHYKLGLSAETLATEALSLGSDCPFFIYNSPQVAAGRGELMTPVTLNLSNFSIQLICPAVHISTAKAFQMITPKPAPFDLRTISELSVVEWKDRVSNDFEAPVFKEHPGLEDIKKQLYNNGALYASMSGSGSSIYGIFPKRQRTVIQTDIIFEEHYLE